MDEIALSIKTICEIAWDVELRVNGEQLKSCVAVALNYSIPSGKARTFVKSVVRLMESMRDDPRKDPVAVFSEIYPATYNQVAIEKEKAQSAIGDM